IVLARGGCARAATAGLFNAQRAGFVHLTLETFTSGISSLGGDHLDEPKATRVTRGAVGPDVALLDLSIFLEKTSHVNFSETRVNAGDEEVGSRVGSEIVGL